MSVTLTDNRVGRPARFGDYMQHHERLAAALMTLGTDKQVSRHHILQMADKNLCKAVKVEQPEGKKGRRPYAYMLTKSGKRIVDIFSKKMQVE